MIASMKERRSRPEFGVLRKELMAQVFHVHDSDDDGKLYAWEHTVFFKCLGIDISAASESYEAVDANRDGVIDCKEFVSSDASFMTTDNENCPSRFFYGQLA